MRLILVLIISCFLSNIALCQTFTDSLKAHYTFDNSLNDETIYENHLGVLNGAIFYSQVSGDDNSLFLNGTANVKTITSFDNSDYETVSISLWFKTDQITTLKDQVILQGAYMGFGIALQPNSGKLYGFFDGSGSGSLESIESLTDDEWHNVIIQTNGVETFMYIDGVLNGSILEPLLVGNGGTNNHLYMGNTNLITRPYTGYLNEVRIYNRFLNQNEIDILSSNPILTSIKEVKSNQELEIFLFPNSGNGAIKIHPPEEYNYQVFSLSGVEMLRGIGYEINTESLTTGMYLVLVQGQTKKLFITQK